MGIFAYNDEESVYRISKGMFGKAIRHGADKALKNKESRRYSICAESFIF